MDLEEPFRRYGNIRHVWVARNPAGFGFVDFEVIGSTRLLNSLGDWLVGNAYLYLFINLSIYLSLNERIFVRFLILFRNGTKRVVHP